MGRDHMQIVSSVWGRLFINYPKSLQTYQWITHNFIYTCLSSVCSLAIQNHIIALTFGKQHRKTFALVVCNARSSGKYATSLPPQGDARDVLRKLIYLHFKYIRPIFVWHYYFVDISNIKYLK